MTPSLRPVAFGLCLLTLAASLETHGAASSRTKQTQPAPARKLEPIPLDEGLKVDLPMWIPQVSPDRSIVAFEVVSPWRRPPDAFWFTATGVGLRFAGARLFIADVSSGQVEPVLASAPDGVSSWGPSWSPDGENLAFLSDRDGMSRLWVWNRRTRTARSVSAAVVLQYDRPFPDWPVMIQWTPDSRAVVVPVMPEGASLSGRGQDIVPRLEKTRVEAAATVQVYFGDDRARLGGDASYRYRPLFSDLSVIEVGTGRVRTLVPRVYSARHHISPDGKLVAFCDPNGLRIVDFSTGATRAEDPIPAETARTMQIRWAPDSSYVIHRTALSDAVRRVPVSAPATLLAKIPGASLPVWTRSGSMYIQAGNRILTVGAAGGEREVAARPDITWTSWVIDAPHSSTLFHKDSDQKVWAWAQRQGAAASEELYEIDLASGESRQAVSDPPTKHGLSTFVARLTSQPVVYFYEDAVHPRNVWLATSDRPAPRRLTHLNRSYEQRVLGESRAIEWLSDDGERLSGALLLPAGYRPGTRYPTVLWVYANDRNTAAFRDKFGLVDPTNHNMQLLATRGYAVFFPESKVSMTTPMLDIAKCILPAVSKLVELGIADPDRIGVMGHSYGMYTTLALLVQTQRFRAAVAFGGMSNLSTYYGSGLPGEDESIVVAERFQGAKGNPWETRELYIENSPYFYFDRVTTPLLLVHGADDPVNVVNSDQTYLGLRRLAKEVVYLRYDRSGHNFTYPPNLRDYWQRVIAWFDKHLAASPRTK